MKKYLIATFVIVLLASSVWSFDGNRKGFVLGGGLGFTPSAKWELDGASSVSGSSAGVAVNLMLGYAFDEKNMIVYEANAAGYEPSNSTVLLTQGFEGASWYHYFNDSGKTFFSIVGLGVYNFKADGFNSNDIGGGFMLGAGYEFARHWQISAYLSGGKTSDSLFDYKHTTFSILINGIAF